MGSPSSRRRLLRDLSDDDDDERDHQAVIPGGGGGGGYEHYSSSDTEDEDGDDGYGRYPFYFYRRVRPRRARLTLQDIFALGPGAALPSPTPLFHQSESDKTVISANGDDDASSPSSVARAAEPDSAPLPELPQLAHQHAAAAAAAMEARQLPPVVAPQPRREHVCKDCGKSYPSGQALGGHATWHKRSKAKAAAGTVEVAPQDDGGAPPASKDGPCVCPECGKEFALWTALGGHQRAHYTGPPIHPKRNNNKRPLEPPAEEDMAAPPPTPGTPPAPAAINPEEELPVVAEEEEIAAPPAQAPAPAAPAIQPEQEPPLPAPAPAPAPATAGAFRVLRLFGVDIVAKVEPPSSL